MIVHAAVRKSVLSLQPSSGMSEDSELGAGLGSVSDVGRNQIRVEARLVKLPISREEINYQLNHTREQGYHTPNICELRPSRVF